MKNQMISLSLVLTVFTGCMAEFPLGLPPKPQPSTAPTGSAATSAPAPVDPVEAPTSEFQTYCQRLAVAARKQSSMNFYLGLGSALGALGGAVLSTQDLSKDDTTETIARTTSLAGTAFLSGLTYYLFSRASAASDLSATAGKFASNSDSVRKSIEACNEAVSVWDGARSNAMTVLAEKIAAEKALEKKEKEAADAKKNEATARDEKKMAEEATSKQLNELKTNLSSLKSSAVNVKAMIDSVSEQIARVTEQEKQAKDAKSREALAERKKALQSLLDALNAGAPKDATK